MKSLKEIRCIEGVGLEGDRYATNKGTYSGTHNKGKPGVFMRQVTLISSREIFRGNKVLRKEGIVRFRYEEFKAVDTRRNLIVGEGIEIQSLIGKEFSFGNVWFRGFEECPPCTIPNKVSGKNGFEIGFKEFGGIRAEILTTGLVWVGASLFVER